MMYASSAWHAQRASWRAVVQLNLIRSVNIILGALADELSEPTVHSPTPSFAPSLSSPTAGPLGNAASDDGDGGASYGDFLRPSDGSPAPSPPSAPLRFTDIHRTLKLRLAPLRRVENDLKRRLGVAAEELPDLSETTPSPSVFNGASGDAFVPYAPAPTRSRPEEATVRSWKNALGEPRDRLRDRSAKGAVMADNGQMVDDVSEVLAGCREDIKALWYDDTVHEMLRRRGTRMEEAAGL